MSNYAVIGLGFGDEGKGLVTDFLLSPYSVPSTARKFSKPLVIRYSGGQQAGHTVCCGETSHVFSNFGSGSLRGVPTYWSKYCTVDPVGLMNEYAILSKKTDKDIVLYLDPEAPVTTPFDKHENRNSARMLKNGTCGVGVGTTFQREEDFYHLKVRDLYNETVRGLKLDQIRWYYRHDLDEKAVDDFLTAVEFLIRNFEVRMFSDVKASYSELIFEGSQGLLLDQHYGFFPHVTRSNTGMKNIFELNKEPTSIFLVTRAYQTRHGNGPMTNTHLELNVTDYPNETNQYNEYQGEFRQSVLDLDLLAHGISSDPYLAQAWRRDQLNLIITCMDRMLSPFNLTYKEQLLSFTDKDTFVAFIKSALNIRFVLVSHGPEAKDIKQWKP